MSNSAEIPLPPTLPIGAVRGPWRPLRLVLVGVAQAASLLLLGALVDGVEIDGFSSAIVAVGVLAIIGALVWPAVIRLTMPAIVATVGLFTFVLNGLTVVAVGELLPGFDIASWWWGLLCACVLTAVTMLVGGLLNIDDDHVWRQKVVRRLVARREPPVETSVPGMLFIQIDGLGAEVLRSAMASDHAPTLASLVEEGTHRLVPWECDLSSQTGAMQAGILHGDNSNIPAFRWYEKESGRVMVANRPKDAADIERRQSTGDGLLVNGGASRTNVFSGDSDDALFTFSRLRDRTRRRRRFVYVVATPFALLRIVVLVIVDIARELRAARRAKRAGVEPRMHRGGTYPLLRAATTVVLAEITNSMMIADILRGVPSVYVDLVGYDEVAHHSGIAVPEALDTLRRTDDQIRRALTTLPLAPRPYHVVVLSDHGQTQGSTFRQRFGESLEELVGRLTRETAILAPVLAGEGWNNVSGVLTEAAADDSVLGRTVAAATRSRTEDGEVLLGPSTASAARPGVDEIVVLASGNLGLISIADLPGRATRQQIDALYPGLIDGLRTHDGIGFILVRDQLLGDLVLGGDGVHHLADDRVEGVDPLKPFGPNAADHLRRTSSFTNCPDLIVNSFYDPETEEGAAFEELIGFHGGLGGRQTMPFVLAPTALRPPTLPLVGARSIHLLFKSWLDQLHGGSAGG
ncbi:MAG: phage holin family protein [Acidimicrobiia bacterium]|nr:phage holin family protein [Acidimicrobiia bacterium]